jgi:N-acetylneuraminate synthase
MSLQADQLGFTIGGRRVGPGQPPFMIAELSGNHNGELSRALALIDAAKAAGADAVKLQTYTADTMTIDCDRPEFRIRGGLWDGYTLHRLYEEAHTPWDWHPALFARARMLGLEVFSTPFDETAVDFLEGLDAPAYKIASFELTDLPLIARAARTGKPMIISTGMGEPAEIAAAVATARENGAGGIALLHCVSAYPAPVEDINLRTIADLAERFGVVAGLSDHTMGGAVAVAAVAVGAAIIEKHVTLRRADGGPDAAFSMEPEEFRAMADGCRAAAAALGQVSYAREASEAGNMQFRRSLYVVADLAPGDVLTRQNVRAIRPGLGLPPGEIGRVLGRRVKAAVARGTPVSLALVD